MLGIILRIAPWLMKAAPFFTLIKGRAKLIGAVVSIATLVGTYLWIGHLNNKIEDLEVNAVLYASQVAQAQVTNEKNISTIASLEAANESFAKAMGVSEDVRVQAIREAAEREAQAAAELGSTLTELERLRNANPTCEQLSKIDMGAACPLVVERLRQHAAGTIGRN